MLNSLSRRRKEVKSALEFIAVGGWLATSPMAACQGWREQPTNGAASFPADSKWVRRSRQLLPSHTSPPPLRRRGCLGCRVSDKSGGTERKNMIIGMHLYRYIPIGKEAHMSWGMTSACQARAQAKYDAKHTTRVSLKLNTGTDSDIIHWLWKQTSKQGAIKQLIREEIAKSLSSDKNSCS